MQKSDSITKLASALSKAQIEIKNAVEDSRNPHFNSKFASLKSVVEAFKGPVAKHGLSYVQLIQSDESGKSHLETVLFHDSGEWISSRMALLMQRSDMQQLGSAVSYARRYSLLALFGIAEGDDDGEAAMDREPQSASEDEGTKGSTPRSQEPAATPQGPQKGASAKGAPKVPNLAPVGDVKKTQTFALKAVSEKRNYPPGLVARVILELTGKRKSTELSAAEFVEVFDFIQKHNPVDVEEGLAFSSRKE